MAESAIVPLAAPPCISTEPFGGLKRWARQEPDRKADRIAVFARAMHAGLMSPVRLSVMSSCCW